jgi:hypothetical protein
VPATFELPFDLLVQPDSDYWIMCDDRTMDLTALGGLAGPG